MSHRVDTAKFVPQEMRGGIRHGPRPLDAARSGRRANDAAAIGLPTSRCAEELAEPHPPPRQPLAGEPQHRGQEQPGKIARRALGPPRPSLRVAGRERRRRAAGAPPSTTRPPRCRCRRAPAGSGRFQAAAGPQRARRHRTAACRQCPAGAPVHATAVALGVPPPIHSNTTRPPVLHHRADRPRDSLRRVGAGEEPAQRAGDPGAIRLLAGTAAERPAPEAVGQHRSPREPGPHRGR